MNIKEINTYRKDLVMNGITSDALEEREFLMEKKVYDEKGNLVTEISYYPNGSIIQQLGYLYDDNGNLIEETLEEEASGIAERKSHDYSENGKKHKTYVHYLDGTYDTIEYIYDDKGRLISKITTDSEGDVDQRKEYKFQDDKLLKETEYDHEDNILDEITYNYDDKGNLMEMTHYDGIEKVTIKTLHEYDEKDRRTGTLIYNAKGKLVEKHGFLFDEKDRIVEATEETPYENNITTMQYDENDNIIEQKEVNAEGEINHFVKRKFDDNNNLLQSSVKIDRHGQGMNQDYTIRNEMIYFE